MLATLGKLPTTPDWAFEFKWDGVRAVTYVQNGLVEVVSRNDRAITSTYPELRALARLPDVVLDGEIVALHKQRPRFAKLQNRMHVGRPSDELLRNVPVVYYVFDLMYLKGTKLTGTGYRERRKALEALGIDLPQARTPPSFVDTDGQDVLASAEEHGLEGVVAKRLGSLYEPGKRSAAWIKVPLVKTQEVVIGGWQPGEGRRQGTIGSLLLGIPDEQGLRYVGKVGTGFTEKMLRELHHLLSRRSTSPFYNKAPNAQWVEPTLIGEVEFRQWTEDGRLRHSSWRGLRPDKTD